MPSRLIEVARTRESYIIEDNAVLNKYTPVKLESLEYAVLDEPYENDERESNDDAQLSAPNRLQ